MIDLRTERLNRGYSLASLASEIGVTKRVLQSAEAGRVPQPANAKRIADYFGYEVTEMWPLDGDRAEA